MYLVLCQYYTALITAALRYSLKSGSMVPSALLFFLKTVFTIWVLLYFLTNFKIMCSSVCGIFIGIALDMWIAWGSMIILTILILPIQAHGISFHLFLSSSVSFVSILKFSKCKFFASLVLQRKPRTEQKQIERKYLQMI